MDKKHIDALVACKIREAELMYLQGDLTDTEHRTVIATLQRWAQTASR